ncbi:MAG TPA: hypothetical protein DCM28_17870 [Phycisphaerales bacterium]|nr:hypothetical protein [Phycisphaerales bacterium]|tara:strand:- start:1812 stop:2735 length:924 start_codon:yes stop_codon:yes gene_type:complete
MPPTVTLREVARQAGVSPTAVSQAMRDACKSAFLSDKRRNEILRVARKVGYRPNDDIAVIMRDRKGGPDPFLIQAFLGVHQAIQASGGRAILEHVAAGNIPQSISGWQCGGVLFLENASYYPQAVESLDEKGIAYATINPSQDQPMNCIVSDDEQALLKGLQWLREQDCMDYAFVVPQINHCSYNKRLNAYMGFIRQSGLSPRVFSDTDVKENLNAVRNLPADKRIGLITINEWYMALDAILSPQHDVKILTLKSANSAWASPQATLDVPLCEMGIKGVEMIHQKWADRSLHSPSIVVMPKLTISET